MTKGRPTPRAGERNAAPAPTSVTWPPPFTHFPWSRGDMLAGEPVPSTPSAEIIAGMPMGTLQHRLKVLGRIVRARRLGERFAEAARAESDALVVELRRRIRHMLADALAPKRGERAPVAQKRRGP